MWFKKHKKLNNIDIPHTCGSWPDPYWTDEMFIKKHEAQEKCLACNPSNEKEWINMTYGTNNCLYGTTHMYGKSASLLFISKSLTNNK